MNELQQRLEGIQKILMGTYEAGIPLSSHSKGFERETFISSFLSMVLPPLYRFGTGEVVDGSNDPSGQLDIVVETPFMPSLPLPGAELSPRLYPPEAVAVAIEVKSDIDTQWDRIKVASEKLGKFERRFGSVMIMGELPKQIPYFAVAYKGPKKLQTLWDRLKVHPGISGVLIVESKLFLARPSALGLSFDRQHQCPARTCRLRLRRQRCTLGLCHCTSHGDDCASGGKCKPQANIWVIPLYLHSNRRVIVYVRVLDL